MMMPDDEKKKLAAARDALAHHWKRGELALPWFSKMIVLCAAEYSKSGELQLALDTLATVPPEYYVLPGPAQEQCTDDPSFLKASEELVLFLTKAGAIKTLSFDLPVLFSSKVGRA